MFGYNTRISQLASDAYMALDRLVKAIENEEDVPEEITLEAEDMMEGFQGFVDTILER